jgi:hypothetical protein
MIHTIKAIKIAKQDYQIKPNKMKATLTFDLRDDQHAFDCAINGVKYFDMIDEFRQHLRSLEKYQDLTEDQYELVGKIREWLATELVHAGISDKF